MRSFLASVIAPPSTLTVPESGLKMSRIMRMGVVLPAPFGPSRPKISPACTSKLTSWTAFVWPKDLARWATEITTVPAEGGAVLIR